MSLKVYQENAAKVLGSLKELNSERPPIFFGREFRLVHEEKYKASLTELTAQALSYYNKNRTPDNWTSLKKLFFTLEIVKKNPALKIDVKEKKGLEDFSHSFKTLQIIQRLFPDSRPKSPTQIQTVLILIEGISAFLNLQQEESQYINQLIQYKEINEYGCGSPHLFHATRNRRAEDFEGWNTTYPSSHQALSLFMRYVRMENGCLKIESENVEESIENLETIYKTSADIEVCIVSLYLMDRLCNQKITDDFREFGRVNGSLNNGFQILALNALCDLQQESFLTSLSPNTAQLIEMVNQDMENQEAGGGEYDPLDREFYKKKDGLIEKISSEIPILESVYIALRSELKELKKNKKEAAPYKIFIDKIDGAKTPLTRKLSEASWPHSNDYIEKNYHWASSPAPQPSIIEKTEQVFATAPYTNTGKKPKRALSETSHRSSSSHSLSSFLEEKPLSPALTDPIEENVDKEISLEDKLIAIIQERTFSLRYSPRVDFWLSLRPDEVLLPEQIAAYTTYAKLTPETIQKVRGNHTFSPSVDHFIGTRYSTQKQVVRDGKSQTLFNLFGQIESNGSIQRGVFEFCVADRCFHRVFVPSKDPEFYKKVQGGIQEMEVLAQEPNIEEIEGAHPSEWKLIQDGKQIGLGSMEIDGWDVITIKDPSYPTTRLFLPRQ